METIAPPSFTRDRALLAIVLLALAVRAALALALVTFPGVADPNHYYNVGVRLAAGQGYTTNTIWQFNDDYAAVTHPDDYWMPLAAYAAGAALAVFGVGVHQALIPFIIAGALLPLIAYEAARQLGTGRGGARFAAACAALLPELVLNSVRTDTTVWAALATGAALLLFGRAAAADVPPRYRALLALGAGAAAGLAYLTRSEAALIVPACAAAIAMAAWLSGRARLRTALLPLAITGAVAALVAVPWLARNWALNGSISTPTTANMFFLTDYNDHYVYNRSLGLDHLLANQTPAQIIGKRLFETAASLKIIITSLDVGLPVALIGGLALLLATRERDRLLALAPALILLAGYFVFYAWLAPYKSQGGSFKKAFLSLVPLLLPVAALAFERAISDRRLRAGAMAITLALLGANAFDTVRLDAAAASAYLGQVEAMAAAARALPDRTGDGAITLMTQDPFIVAYVGFPAVVFPHEPRPIVAEAARRYGVDYLLLPAARPPLDALLAAPALDPAFTRVSAAPGTPFVFFAVEAAP